MDSDSSEDSLEDSIDWNKPIPDIHVTYQSHENIKTHYHSIDSILHYDDVVELKIEFHNYHTIMNTLANLDDKIKQKFGKNIKNINHYPILIDKWPKNLKKLILNKVAIVEPVPDLPENCVIESHPKIINKVKS